MSFPNEMLVFSETHDSRSIRNTFPLDRTEFQSYVETIRAIKILFDRVSSGFGISDFSSTIPLESRRQAEQLTWVEIRFQGGSLLVDTSCLVTLRIFMLSPASYPKSSLRDRHFRGDLRNAAFAEETNTIFMDDALKWPGSNNIAKGHSQGFVEYE
jgi:hypothetical protein